MNEKTLLLQRLGEAYRMLFSSLQICHASGHLSVAETQRLRDALFTLSAQCRTACESRAAEMTGARFYHIAQLLSRTALCLMNGPDDCPQWCRVGGAKLASCVDELEQAVRMLDEEPVVTPPD